LWGLCRLTRLGVATPMTNGYGFNAVQDSTGTLEWFAGIRSNSLRGVSASLMRQKGAFRLNAAGKTGHAAVRADHPMTRCDDRDRVLAGRGSDCPHSLRIADRARDLGVRAGFSKGYGQQLFPNPSRLPSFSFRPGLAPIRTDSLPDRGTWG
jgi:hypothetical protein